MTAASSERPRICQPHTRSVLDAFRLAGVWPVRGPMLIAALEAVVGNAAFFAGERIVAAVDGDECVLCLLPVGQALEVVHRSVSVAISGCRS
jgi:hypothetical protein